MTSEEHLVPLPDGRQLAGSTYGPAGGRPVLFIAGAATGKTMRFGADGLAALGVRLITMDRPGMGSSTDDASRDIVTTAEDYRYFVRSVLGNAGGGLPIVANSQGSVFGLAAALAGWVSRLVLVSPADEVAHPPIRQMLPSHAAALAELVETDPAAASDILAKFGPQEMEQMVLGSASGDDRRIYGSPEFLDMYRRSLQEGFANSGAGYVRDTLMAMRSWGLPLAALECPVDLLVGANDLGHSPDRAEVLTRRIPTASRKIVAGEGGALLWSHAETVLRQALAD